MARIAGVDLPRDKKILYALPYIYGIGLRNAKKILAETGVNADARVRDLRDAEVARLRQVIERDYNRGIARDCRCAASARTPTRAPRRGRGARLRARRSPS